MQHDIQLLSLTDAAVSLGVSRRTIYRLISDKELPAIHVRGKRLIPIKSIHEYVAKQLAAAVT